MFRYVFLLVINISLLVFSAQRSTIDSEKIIFLMQQRKKIIKELQTYLELLEFHQKQVYSMPYANELTQLRLEVIQVLSHNKRLSHLSIEYHCKGSQESLQEISIIIDKMNSLDVLIDRMSKLLIDLDVAISNKDTSQQFLCHASKKIHDIQKKASMCLEQKNYTCLESFYDDLSKEVTNYDRCINLSLHQKKNLRQKSF